MGVIAIEVHAISLALLLLQRRHLIVRQVLLRSLQADYERLLLHPHESNEAIYANR